VIKTSQITIVFIILLPCSSCSVPALYSLVENFNWMKTSDQILIERIHEKDSMAFREFYDRYAALLYKWAYKRTSNYEVTQEITQEFWALFWNTPLQIKTNGEGNAKNFLLHFFTYRVIDYLRANMSKSLIVDITKDLDTLTRSFTYSHISEEIEAKEIYALLDEIIATLPEITQKVFNSRWRDDLTTEETAKLLNIDEKAVYNKMYYAVKTIRERLSVMLDEDDSFTTVKSIKALAVWFAITNL
jgi:RNA polymerase sigma factor (sigma-70 family)